MTRSYKTGLIFALTGGYLLLISAFLTLAIDQAISLIGLYRVSTALTAATGVRNLARLEMSLGNEGLIWAIVAAVLLILVFSRPGRLWLVSLIAALVFIILNLYSGRHVLPQLLVWPSPIALSEQYVQALATNDLDAALRLTDQSEVCRATMEQVFQNHQAQLERSAGHNRSEVAIRDNAVTRITTFYDKPVPTGWVMMQPVPKQLVTLMADRENGGTMWLSLKMSYKPFIGTRYICGQSMDSGS
jgi:hypothetical protein